MSKNVIQCPGCKQTLHESDCLFKQLDAPKHKAETQFRLECKNCNHVWTARLSDFRNTQANTKANPFTPVRIV